MRNIGSSRKKLILCVLVLLLLVGTGCTISFTVKFPGALPAFEYDHRNITVTYRPYPGPARYVVSVPGYFVNYGNRAYTNIRDVYVEVLYKRRWDNDWRSLGGKWIGHDWELYNRVVRPTPSGIYDRYAVYWKFECWFDAAGFPDPKTVEKWKVEVTFDYYEMKGKTVIVF